MHLSNMLKYMMPRPDKCRYLEIELHILSAANMTYRYCPSCNAVVAGFELQNENHLPLNLSSFCGSIFSTWLGILYENCLLRGQKLTNSIQTDISEMSATVKNDEYDMRIEHAFSFFFVWI